MSEEYLGDSVCAEWDNGYLQLYLNNGDGRKNVIIMEPEIYANLIRFIDRCKEDDFHRSKDAS